MKLEVKEENLSEKVITLLCDFQVFKQNGTKVLA